MPSYTLDTELLDVVTLDGPLESGSTPVDDEFSFNNYGLQNSTVKTRWVRLSAPIYDVSRRYFPRSNGAFAETAYFRETRIKAMGTITAASRTALETEMDTMRKNFATENGLLKITWAGALRYYNAYAIGIDKLFEQRDHFHVNFVPWEIELVALHPFGRSEGRVTTDSTITASPTTVTYTNGGTAPTEPIAYITFTTAGTGGTSITWENTTNGDTMTVTKSSGNFANGDLLAIDAENKTVTLNGAAVDYTGVIPLMDAGSNGFKVTYNGTGFTLSLSELHFYRYY